MFKYENQKKLLNGIRNDALSYTKIQQNVDKKNINRKKGGIITTKWNSTSKYEMCKSSKGDIPHVNFYISRL